MLSMDNVDDVIRLNCTNQKNAAEFDPISLRLVPTEDGNSCVLREASQITRTAELSPTQARLGHLTFVKAVNGNALIKFRTA